MKQNESQFLSSYEVIFLLKDIFFQLKKKYLLFIILCICGSLLGYYYASSFDSRYNASSRFYFKDSGASSSFTAISGLASLLPNTSSNSNERAVALINSEFFISRVLLRHVNIKGKTLPLLLHYFQGLQKKSANQILAIKYLSSDTLVENLSIQQKVILKSAISQLFYEKVISVISDKKSGIITLSTEHYDEDFAICLNLAITDELRSFFTANSTASLITNRAILQDKLDSISRQLNSVRLQLARAVDQSTGIFLTEDRVDIKKLNFKEQELASAYAEALKSFQLLDYNIVSALNSTSMIFIDIPFTPLVLISKDKILFSFLGFIFVCFISIFIFVVAKISSKL